MSSTQATTDVLLDSVAQGYSETFQEFLEYEVN